MELHLHEEVLIDNVRQQVRYELSSQAQQFGQIGLRQLNERREETICEASLETGPDR